MFPIYMYVEDYKGLKDFEITFDNNYEIKYNRDKDTLSINKKCESANNNIENFYSIDRTKGNIDSANLLIGKNGSGKTSILEVLNSNLILDIENRNNDSIILYKSSRNDEDFIIEGNGNRFLEIKELPIVDKLVKENYQDNKNYIGKIGVIKFSFREKTMNATQREILFQRYAQSETIIYKWNIGLGNVSKEEIYNYLIKVNQEKNNDNFENAYFTLLIPDLYEELKKSKSGEIKEKIKKIENLDFSKIDSFFKLYNNKNENNFNFDETLNLKKLGISERRLILMLEQLKEKNYITGISTITSISGHIHIGINNPRLTLEGMDFLENNTAMKKAYKMLKEAKEWVPGM